MAEYHGGTATDRDRHLASSLRRVILAWTAIWATIIAFLFVFGADLSAIVV